MPKNKTPHAFWDASLAQQKNIPDWLKKQRYTAKEQLNQQGLPTTKDEAWRYSKLTQLQKQDLMLACSEAHKTAINIEPIDKADFVFVDGQYSKTLSKQPSIEGIDFIPLSEALLSNHPLLERYFNQSHYTDVHAYHLLNTLYAQDGYLLHIKENCQISAPIEIQFIASNQHTQAITWHCRNLIVAEKHSQVQIVERYSSVFSKDTPNNYLNNSITEVFCQENANVDHYLMQTQSHNAYHIGGVYSQQAQHSVFTNHNISLGQSFTRNDIHADLQGKGAHVELNGLIFGHQASHTDNYTSVKHSVPHCTSDQLYKSILDNQSRGIFRARIVVAQDAQKTDAQQQNNNLLLSADAEADSKPELEIYADDVQCSHGATVGQLDAKSLFYLQSRGINRQTAIALLTYAFANHVIEKMHNADIKTQCEQIISEGVSK